MLRNVTSHLGTPILAKDGEIGHLNDVLFDDQSWVIRYFVVEIGSWPSGRRVLLSPFSFPEPKWEKRVLPVNLMREEVRQSPDVDTDSNSCACCSRAQRGRQPSSLELRRVDPLRQRSQPVQRFLDIAAHLVDENTATDLRAVDA